MDSLPEEEDEADLNIDNPLSTAQGVWYTFALNIFIINNRSDQTTFLPPYLFGIVFVCTRDKYVLNNFFNPDKVGQVFSRY